VNGPQHWREADLILTSDPCSYGCPHSGCPHEMAMIGRAIAHSLLAAVTAVIGRGSLTPASRREWLTATEQNTSPAQPTGGTS
jgi:hypothetical protein